VVLGVSGDSVEAQCRFREKYELPFRLLSDPGLNVALAFGAVTEKLQAGKTTTRIQRSTFVIGPDGIVKKVFPNVTPEGHAVEVLEAVAHPE
jgi:peroxiredoxin Q/BCP